MTALCAASTPGSTIKPMFGLVALQHNIVTPSYKINDNGYFYFKGIERPWRDHNFARGGHGKGVDLAKAIIESCNIYFYGWVLKPVSTCSRTTANSLALARPPALTCPVRNRGLCRTGPGKRRPGPELV